MGRWRLRTEGLWIQQKRSRGGEQKTRPLGGEGRGGEGSEAERLPKNANGGREDRKEWGEWFLEAKMQGGGGRGKASSESGEKPEHSSQEERASEGRETWRCRKDWGRPTKKTPARWAEEKQDECEDGPLSIRDQGPGQQPVFSAVSRQVIWGEWVCLEPGGVGLRKVKSLAKALRKMGWETQPRIGRQHAKLGGAGRPYFWQPWPAQLDDLSGPRPASQVLKWSCQKDKGGRLLGCRTGQRKRLAEQSSESGVKGRPPAWTEVGGRRRLRQGQEELDDREIWEYEAAVRWQTENVGLRRLK